MVRPVRQREGVVRQIDDVRTPAHYVKLTGCVEVVCKRNLVNGNTTSIQVDDRFEDDLERRPEKIFGLELEQNLLEDIAVEDTCRKNRFLGFDVRGDRLV